MILRNAFLGLFFSAIVALALTVDAQLEGPYTHVAHAAPPIRGLFVSVIPQQTTIITMPGSLATNTVLDSIVEQQTPAVYGTAYSFLVQLGPESGELESWHVTSGNTNVATNGNAWSLWYRADGNADAHVTVRNKLGQEATKVIRGLPYTNQTNAVTTQIIGGVPGSARDFFTKSIDQRLAAGANSMATNGRIFTTQTHATATYVRNTNGWFARTWGTNAAIDITCISPWNSTGGNQRAGTLVTPQHALATAHFPISAGATIRFVDQTNGVIEKTVTHVANHPSYAPYYPDFQMLRLDSPVDTNRIKPALVLPSDWRSRFPTDIERIPTLALDQEEKALINDGNRVSFSNQPHKQTSFLRPQTNTPAREIYYEDKIGGDSGNPGALLGMPDGRVVLLTVWTFGGAGSGTSVTDFVPDLNSMIQALDTQAGTNTGFQIETANLTPFNAY